jgi:hypothetical protein
MTKPNLMVTSAECREYARFISEVDAFIVLLGLRRLGAIKDVSQGGLGCEFYVNFGEKKALNCELGDSFTAHLFICCNRFHIPDIPCRLAYDIIALEDRPAYSVSVNKRRCGLEFGQLITAGQQQQINFFIEEHTVGRA